MGVVVIAIAMVIGIGGMGDPTTDRSPNNLNLDRDPGLLSDLWTRRALKKDDDSENSRGLSGLRGERASIRRAALQLVLQVQRARLPVNKIIEGIESVLRPRIGGRGIRGGNTWTRGPCGKIDLKSRKAREGRKKRTTMVIWQPRRMRWLPCSVSEGSGRRRSVKALYAWPLSG